MGSDFEKQLEEAAPKIAKNVALLSKKTPQLLVRIYVALRNIKRANDTAAKMKNAPVTQLMDATEAFLLQKLNDAGAESIKTEFGTCYRKTRRYVRVKDWGAFLTWAKSKNQFSMLKKDVSSTEVTLYMEAHPDDDIPPGIEITSETVVNINKPK